MAGFEGSSSVYKPLRPVQIVKSEEFVSKVLTVLESEYINPFGLDIDTSQLVNLSSGMPLAEETTKSILESVECGNKLYEEFQEDRLHSQNNLFHTPIKRNNYSSFSKKTVAIKVGSKVKAIGVNRNIIGNLLYLTVKNNKPIDFKKSLQYPLSPIPLSLCDPDGSRRETIKSKLKEKLLQWKINENNEEIPKDALVIDMIAQIQMLQGSTGTYECFAQKFIKSLPTGYNRLDIIADTYKSCSIK